MMMIINADCRLWDQMQFHLNYGDSQMQRPLKWTTIWSCDDDRDDHFYDCDDHHEDDQYEDDHHDDC